MTAEVEAAEDPWSDAEAAEGPGEWDEDIFVPGSSEAIIRESIRQAAVIQARRDREMALRKQEADALMALEIEIKEAKKQAALARDALINIERVRVYEAKIAAEVAEEEKKFAVERKKKESAEKLAAMDPIVGDCVICLAEPGVMHFNGCPHVCICKDCAGPFVRAAIREAGMWGNTQRAAVLKVPRCPICRTRSYFKE